MNDNHLSNGLIESVTLIETKLPLCFPHGASVEPSSSGSDSFALGVPGITVSLDPELTWFPIVWSLGGRAGATGAIVNMDTATSDHACDARAKIRHVHGERSPSFPGLIEANLDRSSDVRVCKSACNIVRVGRLYYGLETFYDPEFSGAKGLDLMDHR